ncbi:24 kDa secreted protein [Aphelenchoides besseyi]|nr:24 kDa secreted protein [Aphelenchoides besseyi]KAI6195388.1 24 kDa secreted protein [Aphelenchoides besseyi]
MRSTVLILLAFGLFVSADVLDKVASQAQDTLSKATSSETVRQCTCEEQHECVTELEGHGLQCVDSCWSKFNKVTKHPEQLRECFHQSSVTIGSLIGCFEDEATTCTKEKNDKQIPKVDIKKLLGVAAQKLLNAEKNVSSLLSGDVKEVLDTLTEFGTCVKGCLEEKNSGGFCFDKKGCQPLLDSKEEAKKAAKKCTRQVNFKQHASEVCECAKKAGVANLDKLCPLVKAGSEAAQDAVKGSN